MARDRPARRRIGRRAAGSGNLESPRDHGRNHRGFVESLIAANRIGADVLLLNTSFAGPALAEVVEREGVDAVIYDEEFTATVDRALADNPDITRIVAWTDNSAQHGLTLEKLIERAHRPSNRDVPSSKSKLILLTSGTTGTPKGAKHSGGGPCAQGDSGPHPVARRRDRRRRGTDVPRLGVLAAGVRGLDGVHRRHPAQVRSGGHPGARRPPPRLRAVSWCR